MMHVTLHSALLKTLTSNPMDSQTCLQQNVIFSFEKLLMNFKLNFKLYTASKLNFVMSNLHIYCECLIESTNWSVVTRVR